MECFDKSKCTIITEDDIEIRSDFSEMFLYESAWLHRIKHGSLQEFIDEMESNLDTLKAELSKEVFCLLLGFLKYFDLDFEYDSTFRMDKYIGNRIWTMDLDYWDAEEDEKLSLDDIYNNTLECFMDRGLLWNISWAM